MEQSEKLIALIVLIISVSLTTVLLYALSIPTFKPYEKCLAKAETVSECEYIFNTPKDYDLETDGQAEVKKQKNDTQD